MAERLKTLAERAREAGVPVIYVNEKRVSFERT
jgi:rRNA-processing protein FCF1